MLRHLVHKCVVVLHSRANLFHCQPHSCRGLGLELLIPYVLVPYLKFRAVSGLRVVALRDAKTWDLTDDLFSFQATSRETARPRGR